MILWMVAKSPFGDYWNSYEHPQPPGGRHRIGPDLRRCLRGRLGQSIDQATTGGYGRCGRMASGFRQGDDSVRINIWGIRVDINDRWWLAISTCLVVPKDSGEYHSRRLTSLLLSSQYNGITEDFKHCSFDLSWMVLSQHTLSLHILNGD